MKVEIKPTEKPLKLEENLKKRFESANKNEDKIIVETETLEKLERIPGIEEYSVEGEIKQGLKGSPTDEQVYARMNSRKQTAKAYLATIMGYDLRILKTEREWDYRILKKYNPNIKHLRFKEPKKFLGIEKALFETQELEKIEIEMDEKETDQVYRQMHNY